MIQGYDETHRVRHVAIEDVRIGGQKLTKAAHGVLEMGGYVDDVTFR